MFLIFRRIWKKIEAKKPLEVPDDAEDEESKWSWYISQKSQKCLMMQRMRRASGARTSPFTSPTVTLKVPMQRQQPRRHSNVHTPIVMQSSSSTDFNHIQTALNMTHKIEYTSCENKPCHRGISLLRNTTDHFE